MSELPSTGFHYGVPFDQYRSWDAVNIHSLMPLDDSPMHCRYAKDHPKATTEMEVGSAEHVAVFEPARLEQEYYFGQEEYNASTKEGKAVREREMQEAAGRKYIRKKPGESVDCDSVTGMAAALWAFRPAKRFLEMPGQCEVSAIWQDPVTKLFCKGRFDKFIAKEVSPFKRNVIVELKSTGKGKAKTARFGKEIARWYYAAQAAFYMWGVETLTGESPLHVFLPVENIPPYAPNWGTLDDQGLQTGALQFRNWLSQYAECARSDRWPGYPETEGGSAPKFYLPEWANRQNYDND